MSKLNYWRSIHVIRPTQPATNWTANEYRTVVTVHLKAQTSDAEKFGMKRAQSLVPTTVGTLLSSMSLVNVKAVIFDLCISETDEENLVKIGRGRHVAAKFVCANLKKWARGFSSDGIFSFCFIKRGTSQTAEPILTRNTSKEPVWAKEVPLRS